MKILVTGASGLVGRTLINDLQIKGHEVYALVRSPHKITELDPKNVYKWEDSQPPPPESLAGKDAVINLVGEGIADKYWTEKRKQTLRDSRLITTKNLTDALRALPAAHRPKTLISTSAIGIYGVSTENVFDETSPVGSDFLAKLCQEWEAAAYLEPDANVRTVIMRFGIVLSKNGGFLGKMAPVILGDGKQWVSWIHIKDILGFVHAALADVNLAGPYNLTSPNPITNRDLTKIFAKKMGFPVTVSAPSSALKLFLGEMANVILGSQKVNPNRLQRKGFKFEFSDFKKALDEIYSEDSFLDNYHIVSQFIPANKDEVFDFFSRAENLERITPPWLSFKISKKSAEEISENVLIDYKLKIHGVPVKWRTLISAWQPNTLFIDDQLKGPYNKWHHIHQFYDVPGGTLIRDEVTFRVPGSIVGKLLLTPWIKKDVNTIFTYRQKVIGEVLPSKR